MDTKIIMILMMIAGIVMGYQFGIASKDCERDYNRGYGDALYYALEHQRAEMQYDWSKHPNYTMVSNGSINFSMWGFNQTNLSQRTYYRMNMTPNMTMPFLGCYQNETGYNASDLVMHITCKNDRSNYTQND